MVLFYKNDGGSAHDEIIKWKHFRCEGNPPVTGGFPHKGQWRRALKLSLICAQTNGWWSTGNGVDLRRHCAHYDVTVMNVASINEITHPVTDVLLIILEFYGCRVQVGIKEWRRVVDCHLVCSCKNNEANSTYWCQDKMTAFFQTTFSDAFSCMKMYGFLSRFHWSFFSWGSN